MWPRLLLKSLDRIGCATPLVSSSLRIGKERSKPRPTVDWYLERINNAIEEARNASENKDEVVLLAHSAGGWLSRVYLESEDYANAKWVSKVISLGSPLNAVPLDVPGVVDQTRGILTYVEANCLSPKSLGIEWICLAGTYKTGVKEFSRERFSDFIVGQGSKMSAARSMHEAMESLQ